MISRKREKMIPHQFYAIEAVDMLSALKSEGHFIYEKDVTFCGNIKTPKDLRHEAKKMIIFNTDSLRYSIERITDKVQEAREDASKAEEELEICKRKCEELELYKVKYGELLDEKNTPQL